MVEVSEGEGRGEESGGDAQKSRLRTPPLFVAPSIELPKRCSALYRSWPARACGEGDDDEAPLGEMRPSGTSGWMDPVLKSVCASSAFLLLSPPCTERARGGRTLEGEVARVRVVHVEQRVLPWHGG